MTRHSIEILTFDGCPNAKPAADLVTSVLRELQVDADVQLVDVHDQETARRRRFLGSPTIRVDGRDIEPGADNRNDFVVSCRVYRTESGVSGQPDRAWLRSALSAD